MDVLPNMVRLVANHANLVVRNITGMSEAKSVFTKMSLFRLKVVRAYD
jgi:hypothetical protein